MPRPAPAASRDGPPGRPKSPDKARAILAAARRRFLRDGLSRTSVDAVAADAGVSKVTVYSHFGDKAGLFVAVMRKQADALGFDPGQGNDAAPTDRSTVRRQLEDIGLNLLQFLGRPELAAFERVLAVEARDHPALARRFWDFGPGRVVATLAAILRGAAQAGLIRPEAHDPTAESAAERLIGAWKGLSAERRMAGLPQPVRKPGELSLHVQTCVDDFLTARQPDAAKI